MDDRALDHALEAGRRLGVPAPVGDQVGEFGVDVLDEVAAQHIEIDIAGAHHRRRVLVLDQGEQEVLERGIFVPALIGGGERSMEGLVRGCGKSLAMSPSLFRLLTSFP